jgi:hypothetical protein
MSADEQLALAVLAHDEARHARRGSRFGAGKK